MFSKCHHFCNIYIHTKGNIFNFGNIVMLENKVESLNKFDKSIFERKNSLGKYLLMGICQERKKTQLRGKLDKPKAT